MQQSPDAVGKAIEVLDTLETEVIGSGGADVHENEPPFIGDGVDAPDEQRRRYDGQCVETGPPALWVALRLRGGGDDKEDDESGPSQRLNDAAAGRSPRASDSAREQIDPPSRQMDRPPLQADAIGIEEHAEPIEPPSPKAGAAAAADDSDGYSPEPSPTGDEQTEQPPCGGQPTPFIPPPLGLGGGAGPERGANPGKRPAPGRGARERRRGKRAREHGPRLLYGALPPPQPPTQPPPPLPPPPKPPPPPPTGPERAQQAAWYTHRATSTAQTRGESRRRDSPRRPFGHRRPSEWLLLLSPRAAQFRLESRQLRLLCRHLRLRSGFRHPRL